MRQNTLPGRRNADVVVTVVVPVVIDVQTLGIEVADVDTVTVRVEILLIPICVTRSLGLLLCKKFISYFSCPLLGILFWKQFSCENISTRNEQEVLSILNRTLP